MELVKKLKGKLNSAYLDTITADERVDVCLPGSSGEGIVVTDKRVIILKAGKFTGAGFFGAKAKSFPYNQITSVDLRIATLGGHLQLTTAGSDEIKAKKITDIRESENAISFDRANRENMKAVAELIRSRLGKTESTASSSGSVADELKKLAELKSQGILSDEEFESAKKRLL